MDKKKELTKEEKEFNEHKDELVKDLIDLNSSFEEIKVQIKETNKHITAYKTKVKNKKYCNVPIRNENNLKILKLEKVNSMDIIQSELNKLFQIISKHSN